MCQQQEWLSFATQVILEFVARGEIIAATKDKRKASYMIHSGSEMSFIIKEC
jgi:hypothetical protein